MKKILLVHHCDSWGGAGISLISLIKMLKGTYEVSVVVPNEGSAVWQKVKKEKVEVIAMQEQIGMISAYNGGPKTFSRTFLRNYFQTFKNKGKLESIIERIRPDIVAVNSMTLSWIGKLVGGVAERVCFIRETQVNNLGMKIIKYELKKHFDKIIYISEFDRRHFALPNKSCVVRDSVEKDRYKNELTKPYLQKALGLDVNKKYVIFVGGDDPIKGLKQLQQAFQYIGTNNIECVVAGNVAESNKTEDKRFHYIGKQLDMAKVYGAADVLVFCPVFAHQGRPVFEAGFLKLPVIVPDFEELSECVEDKINGLIFARNNSKSLAKRIIEILEDDYLYDNCAENNYVRSLKEHEESSCRNDLLQFLAE